MREHALIVASWITVAVLAAIATIALALLPEGARIPVHWNVAGEADRYAGAAFGLFTPVVMSALLSLAFAVLPRIEPLQTRMQGSAVLYRVTWAGLLALMVVVEVLVAAPAFGWTPSATLPLAVVGTLLIVVGNVLPKSRPGFFVGIRTPWALLDTDNWIATHRLGAWTMMAGGAALLIAGLLPMTPAARMVIVIGALLVSTLPPVVYSWLLWHRREPR